MQLVATYIVGSQSDKSGGRGTIVPGTVRIYLFGAAVISYDSGDSLFLIQNGELTIFFLAFCEWTRLMQIRYFESIFEAVSSDEFSIAKGIPKNESPKICDVSNQDHEKRKGKRRM